MGTMKCMRRPNKIMLIPYPAQGHVTPMIKLASVLVNRGFEPIIVTPEFIHRRIDASIDPALQMSFMSIPDGLEEDTSRDFLAIEKAMEHDMPIHLEKLVHDHDDEEGRIVCIVVDLVASWAIDVANRCGVPVAGFWPATLAAYRLIAGIPDMIRGGLISDSGLPKKQGEVCFLSNEAVLSTEHLPWLIGNISARKARFKFWTRTLDRSTTLRWLLVNSFPNEFISDEKQLNHLTGNFYDQNHVRSPIIFQVGPLGKNSLTKNPSFWTEDTSCLEWLDKQKHNSVTYISFGSWISPIGEAKVRDLALALEASGRPFIWVLRSDWREGLPFGYLERASKQGKVISWAPQMKVLQHKSVGCYLTHCGWNSIMEAIQCQKRMLCYPVAGDQFVNCVYVVNVWKIGAKMNGFEREEVKEGLEKVMKDSEMSKRLVKLHERTMGEEASLIVTETLTAFIDDLKQLQSSLN